MTLGFWHAETLTGAERAGKSIGALWIAWQQPGVAAGSRRAYLSGMFRLLQAIGLTLLIFDLRRLVRSAEKKVRASAQARKESRTPPTAPIPTPRRPIVWRARRKWAMDRDFRELLDDLDREEK